MPRGDTSLVEQVKARAKKPVVKKKASSYTKDEIEDRILSSGSTMLNLACTDTVEGAFMQGKMVNIIGGTSTGKTTVGLSVLAEASQHKIYDNYDLILDDAEAANEFNIVSMFGQRLADRIQPPSKDGASDTVTDLQSNILNRIESGRPFIYVQDSFDSITTDEELERAYAIAAGKTPGGTFGAQKAKGASALFRIITRGLDRTKSILIIISQIRDNINAGPFAPKHRRVGGNALDFYAFNIIWLTGAGAIKKGDVVVGHDVRIRPSKNKINGKLRSIDYQTYDGYGIDDIGSMVNFMVGEKFWDAAAGDKKEKKRIAQSRASDKDDEKKEKKNAIISAKLGGVGIEGKRDWLIRHIESTEGLTEQLRNEVQTAWLEREDRLKSGRKPKYE